MTDVYTRRYFDMPVEITWLVQACADRADTCIFIVLTEGEVSLTTYDTHTCFFSLDRCFGSFYSEEFYMIESIRKLCETYLESK